MDYVYADDALIGNQTYKVYPTRSRMETTHILPGNSADPELGRTIFRLINEANLDERPDRRQTSRRPFSRPVQIVLNGSDSVFPGFTRDISPVGIGLLHDFPIDSGQVIVTIENPSGLVSIRTEILWCLPAREGWYQSGGRFIDVIASHE